MTNTTSKTAVTKASASPRGSTLPNGAILYVVATPIGNLGDMVPRAIETLQTADVIAAEDTRHSARLLEYFHITTPMLAYHDHSGTQQVDALVERLLAGERIALICDAGTPLISDPGFRLVRAARDAGVQVVPVPGACAMVAALSAAGLPCDRFIFEGFLSAKSAPRCKRLQALANEERTLIFYEAPHRVLASLVDMAAVFGRDREAVLARELTKAYETIYSDTLAGLVRYVEGDSNQQRGEIVLLVRGTQREQRVLDASTEHTMQVLLSELTIKQAASLGTKITGIKKNVLYQWALEQTQPNK